MLFSIREKLITMGYGYELNNIKYPDNFYTHPLVNQTRALTDRSTYTFFRGLPY